MRRVAALYDIHGNLPALDAVLDEVRREPIDLVVVGGDVLPGPMPVESLERLLALDRPVRFLMGNGDRETLAFRAGRGSTTIPDAFRESMRWNAQRLATDHVRIIERWPPTIRVAIEGVGDALFCHATPTSDTVIITRLTPDDRVVREFGGHAATVVVCGHTHMPFDRLAGGVRVVNAGSVGMPFGAAGAHWLVLGPAIEPRRTLYDLDAAADRIRRTAYPDAETFAATSVLCPPREDEMLRLFEPAEKEGASA